ncbi:glycosyltransferase family 9 protein [Mailhella massiliensis]|uniref:Glycosyltransferase family 9 protein n=1 Tax=Mailhella massiliensis TaxID=1903261 RepID=A0A921DSH2_9BACT|nr:glycosyltransferase family 9 protein [Mailhella massiliensis]HJD96932.1 hypothetical protein [Mailhella massiliensis]
MKRSFDFFDHAHNYVEHCRRHWAGQPVRASWQIGLWGLMHVFSAGKDRGKNASGPLPKIAFLLDGGLGDTIVNAHFIREFFRQCGPMQLDICTNYPEVFDAGITGSGIPARRIGTEMPDEDCDLVLYCLLIPSVVSVNRARLDSTASPRLRAWLESLEEMQKREPLWFRMQENFMGPILAFGRLHGCRRRSLPFLAGGLEATEPPRPAAPVDAPLPELPAGRPFITVHRGTGDCPSSTKLWSTASYNALLALLRRRFPEMTLVQVGHEQESALSVDADLRGKTTFPQFARLLQESRLHICSEGGGMHLRHVLCGRPSLVFFGPTDPEFYGYAENLNLRAPFCTPCEWLTRSWQTRCSRDFDNCRCLEKLTPEMVWHQVENNASLLEALCSRAS